MSPFFPYPFKRREITVTGLAVGLAVASSFVVRSAGMSGTFAWILSVTVGTLILLVAGQKHRLFFTSVFCLAFYVGMGITWAELRFQDRPDRFPWPRPHESAVFGCLFVLGVVVPVGLAWIVSKIADTRFSIRRVRG